MRLTALWLTLGALTAIPPFTPASTPVRFTPADAVRAEWARRPPSLSRGQVEALPAADRARLEMSLKRIGAPGSPALLPPELQDPTEPLWLEKAKAAKTAQERFIALHFLNRLKSKEALVSLDGLTPANAKSWPKHLHLENAVARARLNGCEVTPGLRMFLNGLAKAGKVDPVRAQAARLRLVLAGVEKELLPPVEPTPGAILALLDAWNTGPWEARKESHLALLRCLSDPEAMKAEPAWRRLGLSGAPYWRENRRRLDAGGFVPERVFPAQAGILQRLLEGLPDPAPADTPFDFAAPLPTDPALILVIQAKLSALAKIRTPESIRRLKDMARMEDPRVRAAALPALRAVSPPDADSLRKQLLEGPDPMGRGYAVDDLPAAPPDLEALLKRLWKPEELDGIQSLIGCLDKWKLPQEQEVSILRWLSAHPSWTARYLACERLAKLDKNAPWPEAPPPTEREKKILDEAVRLAEIGKPVRLQITFAGKGNSASSGTRSVVLRLDPKGTPINVANLKLLAGEGFFNGHAVPRVVPDFVVQMGSPLDTMDGGPGYAVRCENSLAWYGPGSVGMALSGKDTGGSQFFITTNATPHLTGRYTRVGEVEDPDRALPFLDGLELGARIQSVEVLEP